MGPNKLTPPQLASTWGVTPEKILNLIRSGDLRAVNISSGKRRARYLIDEADIAEFETRRATRPRPSQERERPSGRSLTLKEYV